MSRTIVSTLLLIAFVCTVPSQVAFSSTSNRYTYELAPGDNLTITVFGEEELSGPYTVDAEGYLQLPLGGPLLVEGLTLKETQARLTERLADGYLINPEVSIRIAELRPVFIIGSVNRPGSFPYRFGMTAAEVVALAGGFGSAAQTTSSLPDLIAAKERLALLKQKRRDLLIRLARTDAELLRSERIILPPEINSDTEPRVLSMIAHQQALLIQLNEQEQRSLELINKQRPRIEAEIEELKKERKAAVRKFELASDYAKIQDKLKAKGWARAITVLNAETSVARFDGEIAGLDGKLSNLHQSMGDLELQIQKEEKARMQRITSEKQIILANLNEVETSIPPAERIVELRQNEVGGDIYSDQDVTYTIELIRKTNSKGERPQADLLDAVSPGDILDVRVTLPDRANNVATLKRPGTEGTQPVAARHSMAPNDRRNYRMQ